MVDGGWLWVGVCGGWWVVCGRWWGNTSTTVLSVLVSTSTSTCTNYYYA